jgi:predicted SAM-dependent methyltransferase
MRIGTAAFLLRRAAHKARQAASGVAVSAFYGRDRYVRALRSVHAPLRLVIGAGGTRYDGWLSTDVAAPGAPLPLPGSAADASLPLDITDERQWARAFDEGTVSNMLSEHVFEHLTDAQLASGLALCRKYLAPGGRLRIAVPDGRRPDARYIAAVAPPVDGHFQLFTIESMSALLESAGFAVEPLEHYDAQGALQRRPYDEADGVVLRCWTRDRQADFAYADHHYTSIIVDAVRPRGGT